MGRTLQKIFEDLTELKKAVHPLGLMDARGKLQSILADLDAHRKSFSAKDFDELGRTLVFLIDVTTNSDNYSAKVGELGGNELLMEGMEGSKSQIGHAIDIIKKAI